MSKEVDSFKEEHTFDQDLTDMLPRVSAFRRFSRVLIGRKVVLFGLIVILVTIITAFFAPYIAPYDPNEQNLTQTLLQPSRDHLLGTDALGRDTLSRLIFGTRPSLIVGIVAIGIAATIGMMMGLVAAYFGGMTHTIIMRFIDAMMAFPMLLLALVIAALLGGGLRNVVIALGIGLIPSYSRLMCAQALTVKQNDYITSQRAMGSSNLRIMLLHILPNCFPPLIVLVTMMLGMTILLEASLSFLGVGISPPTAAWGAMVADGYKYLTSHPVLSFAPGVAMMLVVFAFNMVGDGLRDALDPRLRGIL